MKKQKGFSLIELLIVVAIILIIAAIAIPNLLRSRIAANETSAVGTLRTYTTGQLTYAAAYPDQGFASDLAHLGGTGTTASSTNALILDPLIAKNSAVKSGYMFTFTPGSGTPPLYTYSISAAPVTPGVTGGRYFFTDQTGVIRYNATAVATSADSPIQ